MVYDFIIAGSGCAGLSLLHYILNEKTLKNKKVLILDKAPKTKNDRTWCYWEKEEGPFESIVSARWNSLDFNSGKKVQNLNLKSYTYKMIQGLDFYEFVLKQANSFENIEFQYQNIININQRGNLVNVTTEQETFKAEYVFNSTSLFYPEINTSNSLLQHFMGWEIEVTDSVFDPEVGTLMDFSVHQNHGATFMYVLPTSATKALVEYTLFSPEVLDKQDYKNALEDYILNSLKIESYQITHKEFGVIPMSLASFSETNEGQDRIVQMGTAGGFTKASTGYTFQFIQKHCQHIIERLKVNQSPVVKPTFREKTFDWYDRTVLDVLIENKVTGKDVFTEMFENVPVAKILAFLGNESTWLEDFQIMRKLPIWPFLTSGIKQLNK